MHLIFKKKNILDIFSTAKIRTFKSIEWVFLPQICEKHAKYLIKCIEHTICHSIISSVQIVLIKSKSSCKEHCLYPQFSYPIENWL